MSQPRIWIATVVIAAAFAPVARADSKNEIRSVTFDEDGGTTRIHVRGAQTPTFTVYKLERPSRRAGRVSGSGMTVAEGTHRPLNAE